MNRRPVLLLVALGAAFALAGAAGRPPAPLPVGAPLDRFSAGRAMLDIAAVARDPHPTGSAEDAVVRAYLVRRLEVLGLQVSVQAAPLSQRARDRLKAWGEPPVGEGANIVGVLPGRDRTAAAVVLMAHHDTVSGSPGAADDSAGVAAILETLRGLKSSPDRRRDVVAVFTDAEELNSDGAAAFFSDSAWASRIGAVINLEARGGGGRALMFETGPDNGALVRLYARSVSQPSAQSLAVLAYRLLPNSSDFSLAHQRGLSGVNIAFLGRPGLYHAPQATPRSVDPGSVQHLGGQTLDLARALAEAPALPSRTADAVFGDLLGAATIVHPGWAGWIPLLIVLVLFGFAGLRARAAGGLDGRAVIGGAAGAVWALVAGGALLWGFDLVSGAGPAAGYYDRLAALPLLELQAGLVGLAVLVALGTLPSKSPWSRWLGAALAVLVPAVLIQAAAPMAAPLFAWPLFAAGLAAAGASLIDPRLKSPPALGLIAALGVVAAAQTLYLGHFAFLGLGADLPAAAAVVGLLAGLTLVPLMAGTLGPKARRITAAMLLLAALVCALAVRLDPPASTIPTYARAPVR